MTLEPLATLADLTALNIDTSNVALADSLLASVSAAVREAAGTPITETTSTVRFATESSRRVELPARPVRSVSSVKLDGEELTEGVDFVVRDGHLWRLGGRPWHDYGQVPRELEVTFTHGYTQVPADIVRTVCVYVAAGIAAAQDGFEGHRGLQYRSIDDVREGFLSGADEVVDPTELTERTKAALRARFGGGRIGVIGAVR